MNSMLMNNVIKGCIFLFCLTPLCNGSATVAGENLTAAFEEDLQEYLNEYIQNPYYIPNMKRLLDAKKESRFDDWKKSAEEGNPYGPMALSMQVVDF